MVMEEVAGSEFEIECDLVLLALGFLGPEPDGIIAELGLKLDPRGNVPATTIQRARPTCSRRATRAAASRWWSGRFGKAANARAPSTPT